MRLAKSMCFAGFAPIIVLAFLMSPPAFAQSDCHDDMKDMLQGTLDIAHDINMAPRDLGDPADCTLASWR
jgi:hypothetical protein